jgi:hypothetical protein
MHEASKYIPPFEEFVLATAGPIKLILNTGAIPAPMSDMYK